MAGHITCFIINHREVQIAFFIQEVLENVSTLLKGILHKTLLYENM